MVEFTNISTYSLVDFLQVNSSLSSNGSISVYLTSQRVLTNVYAKIVINIESADHQVYDLEFINKTVNVCEFLDNKTNEPLLQGLYSVLNKDRSFPTSCPLRKVYRMMLNHIFTPPINFPFFLFHSFNSNRNIRLKTCWLIPSICRRLCPV